MDAASTSISRKRPLSSIPAPMPFRRLPRTALSLLIAYAIVLGGVLAPALGHGFDPSAQLCTYGAEQGAADSSPEAPQTRGMHDCCPAACGGLSAILPPVAEASPAVFRVFLIPAPRADDERMVAAAYDGYARAPPAG